MLLATASRFQTRDSRRFGAHTLGNLRLGEARLRTRLEKRVKQSELLCQGIIGVAECWVFLPFRDHLIVRFHDVFPSTVYGQGQALYVGFSQSS
jgi:hypothetical protein